MRARSILFGVLFIAVGLLAGLVFSARLDILPRLQSETALPLAQGLLMEDAIIKVADTSGKAVVSISTVHTTKMKGAKKFYYRPYGNSPFSEDDPFQKFFGDFFGEMPDREFKQMGLGSGVIIDAKGHILTNEHVIDGADKVTVTLSDGREFKAEIKGQDARSDLAVIKINANNLPVANLGDSENLKIGQWVVAIGNPFGFAMQNPEPTVTVGVISALHRTLGRISLGDRDYNDLIQTDAAINPGNSGGPLVNLKGEVVGINVAIFSTSGGYQGVGFAIPISTAKRIISRLVEGKKISYGWLGVTVQDLTDDLTKYFGLSEKKGVLVAKVLEDGPAQKGGIKDSDIIKMFDNKPVNSVKELVATVSETEVGRAAKVVVFRDKKELTLDVRVGERPQGLSEDEPFEPESEASVQWRGLSVQEKKGQVVVVDLEAGSAAEEAGIMPQDIILEINKKEIKSLADYQKIIKGLKGDALIKSARGYFLIKDSG